MSHLGTNEAGEHFEVGRTWVKGPDALQVLRTLTATGDSKIEDDIVAKMGSPALPGGAPSPASKPSEPGDKA